MIFLLSMQTYSQKTFIDQKKILLPGIFYYPEHWDESNWERDIKNMSDLGFEYVHMAEFAWSIMEPEEGVYNFDWLDRIIMLCEKYNLKMILGTPSAAPPTWVSKKYPETMLVTNQGIRATSGSRQYTSWSSEKYQELVEKIVIKMAEKYGHNENVIGWQIDNEPSHYSYMDYSEAAKSKFKEWLKEKYGNINQLNEKWGSVFWSGIHNSFDSIELPNNYTQINGIASTTSFLDFKRFSSQEAAKFINMQARAIRKHSNNNQWITTNACALFKEIDAFAFTDLDFLSYTIYHAQGTTKNLGEQGFRMGEYIGISRNSDYTRSFSGTSACLEIQPGQLNWAPNNVQIYPGAVYAWLWQCFASDVDFISSYRYRQPLFGYEQYHEGIIRTDGISLSEGGKAYKKFISELKDLRKNYDTGKNPVKYEEKRTAYLVNYDNIWVMDVKKQASQWDVHNHLLYEQLKRLIVPVDFVEEDQDFTKYPVLVAPAYQIVDQPLINKWQDYVNNGGNLILTCRSAQMDKNAHFWDDKWAAPISELIGGEVEFYDMLPIDKHANVRFGEKNYEWNNWGDILNVNEGTNIWAKYSSEFYIGKTAVSHKKHGQGSVTYIGVQTDNGNLERDILKKLYTELGFEIQELPYGLHVDYREGFGVAINHHTSKDQEFKLPEKAKIIKGNKVLKTADVLIWQE
ncbi:MAG: beta-galactosidase [Prolixibacteraceae bacterium]|nr:beta-galactosidase [Prolixibacteraceae bacterium]